ncbi:MAG: TolC family protein [Candidatus Limimorpha sp.]
MMMFRKLFLTVVAAILALQVSAQNTDALTLDSCFALAKANNAELKMNMLEIEKAHQVKAQIYTKYFPQISASYSAFYSFNPLIRIGVDDIGSESFGDFLQGLIELLNDEYISADIPSNIDLLQSGNSVNATLVQPLYAGGRIVNGNRLAELGVQAAELKAQVSERDLIESIESSYYLVLGLQMKVNTINEALSTVDSIDKMVNSALEAGVVTKADVLQVALKRNELLALNMKLNNGIVLASRLLCHQIGIEYPENGIVLDDNIESENEKVLDHNEDFFRPEMSLLQMQIDAEVLRKKLTLGETLPTVGLGAVFFYGNMVYKKFSGNAIVFARVSVPISSWWETSHKLKEHDVKIEQAELMKKDLSGKMLLQEEQAYNMMVEAQSLLDSDYAALDMAKENYRIATINYNAGLNTIADVLQANALLLQAENAITDRKITYLTARRKYHDLTGK